MAAARSGAATLFQPPLPPLLMLSLLLVGLAAAAVGPSCQLCVCSEQGRIYHLLCRLSSNQSLVLDGEAALNFSSRVLYVSLEGAGSVEVRAGFLRALRRYQSVAVDFWQIGRLSFDAEFRPDKRFEFVGIGIENCSLPFLPQGVFSHSQTVGLRLSGVTIDVIHRGAFADVDQVRYVYVTRSRVGVVEGPQTGRLHLSHRRDIHHGNIGLRIADSRVGVLMAGALRVSMDSDQELVSITSSTVDEVGAGGLSVVGDGAVTFANTTFGFLATGSLHVQVTGAVSLTNCTVVAAAPLPLASVRGGNRTSLDGVTFGAPPSTALVLLDRPDGGERLRRLRFACRRLPVGWASALTARRSVPDGEKRYLCNVAVAASCVGDDEAADSANSTAGRHSPDNDVTAGQTGDGQVAMSQAGAGDVTRTRVGQSGDGLFSSVQRVALELAILAACGALVAGLVLTFRRWGIPPYRRSNSDTGALVDIGSNGTL